MIQLMFTIHGFVMYFFLGIQLVFSQKNNDDIPIGVHLHWKTDPIEQHHQYFSKTDTLQIDVLKFYISNVTILYTDGTYNKEKNSYHLIDIDNMNSRFFKLKKQRTKKIKALTFDIGIDSTTNVSGLHSNDLDVVHGMYWAWQSGYVNMKIEGTSKSCKTRKNEFKFHVGGYLSPYNALRTIRLYPKTEVFEIIFDFAILFESGNLSVLNHVMTPGVQSMQLADILPKMIYLNYK